jgi:hypothetical protein
MRRFLTILAAVVGVVVAALVLVGNFAVARTNPPVTYTIQWDSPRTEVLARAACFDCHSNETRWPWYAHVAPVAEFIVNEVDEGRREMNFSTDRGLNVREMISEIERGNMPTPNYLLLHSDANLSAEDQAALIAGLRATFGN